MEDPILTRNEARLILAIRSLKPFEKVVISADKTGHIDSYIVERSFKEIWSELNN
jgi:hypothetical protein